MTCPRFLYHLADVFVNQQHSVVLGVVRILMRQAQIKNPFWGRFCRQGLLWGIDEQPQKNCPKQPD